MSSNSEADTCRKYVVPKLTDAGWENEPHSIAEQRTFTDGRIIVTGGKVRRGKRKRADYLLRYTRDFPIAVVEAKPEYKTPSAGLGQAKDYAEILGVKFAYSTNGHGIVEFDYATGLERELDTFPTPVELWDRLRSADKLNLTLKEQIDTYRANLRQEWLILQSRGKEAARQEAAPVMEENARIAELERALLEANQQLGLSRQQNEQQRIDFEMRMEQQRVELRERLAASQREMDERLAAIDRENKLAEAEMMRRDAVANSKARDIQQDAQRTELISKCNSPQVQQDLAPFLAEGIWQPGDYKTNARLNMAPMSYSKIQSDGALADSIEGLQLFLEIVNRKGCHPRGDRNSSYYSNSRNL